MTRKAHADNRVVQGRTVRDLESNSKPTLTPDRQEGWSTFSE